MDRDKKVNILVQIGLKKEPDLPRRTAAARSRQNADGSSYLPISSPATRAMGFPSLAPPDVPPERVEALRQAFQATVVDPVFLADADKRGAADPVRSRAPTCRRSSIR